MIIPGPPPSYSPYDRLFEQLFKQIFRPGVARRGFPFKNCCCSYGCCFRGLSENSNSNIYQEFDGVIGGPRGRDWSRMGVVGSAGGGVGDRFERPALHFPGNDTNWIQIEAVIKKNPFVWN